MFIEAVILYVYVESAIDLVQNRAQADRDSSGGTTTRYGLDGPGMNPGGGEIFCTRPDRPWGPPSFLYNVYRVFPGRKRPERCVDHPPHLALRLKKEQNSTCISLWAFVVCSNVIFAFTFYLCRASVDG